MDVNAKDPTGGRTSLSWAVTMGNVAVVKLLLDEDRVDRNCKDSSGRTPLTLIIGDRTGKILTLLLEKGTEVNFTYKEVSKSDVCKI